MSYSRIISARQFGKSLAREASVDRAVLLALFEAGGELDFVSLYTLLPVTRRELFRSLNRQHTLGNVKRHRTGEPIALTASARAAIDAGRAGYALEALAA